MLNLKRKTALNREINSFKYFFNIIIYTHLRCDLFYPGNIRYSLMKKIKLFELDYNKVIAKRFYELMQNT